MNPLTLAGVLKRVYSSFSMESFNNRLKLQKFVYLLKAFGINLGYNFNFYIYGPYSTQLMIDGYQVTEFGRTPEVKFEPELEEKFNKFKEFYKNHREDIEWLEIAASVHLLKQLGLSYNEIINKIKNKRPELNDKETQINKIIEELKEVSLIE